MTTIRTFRYGGIEISPRKLEPDHPITTAFLPADAILPLRQHAGPPARRVVEVGEVVREGQLVGKASGAGSANIHSPIPGVVKAVRSIPELMGGQVDAVSIALEGSFERLGKKTETFPWKGLTKHQILRAISEKGVVEDDGPGTPLFDRLHDPKGLRQSCVLIVNGLESDPWNSSAKAVLGERSEAVREGIEILKKVLAPERTLLALDAADPRFASGQPGAGTGEQAFPAEPVPLEPRYPQDLPALLREAITGRKGFSGETIVVSVATVASVYDAVVLNKPQVERYVTVTGDAVKSPCILRARIGTSIGELLEESGGFRSAPESIILNGPFRGCAVADLDFPVLKTTRSIVALTVAETRRRTMTACIRCGRCVLACPVRLDPSRLYKRVVRGGLVEALSEGLDACTECGTCAYLCPSRLPLVQAFSLARREAARKGLRGEVKTA